MKNKKKIDKIFSIEEVLIFVLIIALFVNLFFSIFYKFQEIYISEKIEFQYRMHMPLSGSLVGWWNFNDPEHRYKDVSANGNHANCRNCPMIVEGVPGTNSEALKFDGLIDYISLVNDPLNFGSDDFTVSLWVSAPEGSNEQTIISKGSYFLTYPGWHISSPATQDEWIVEISDSRIRRSISLGIGLYWDDFKHIVFVRRGQNLEVYLNGMLVDISRGVTGSVSNNYTANIAARASSPAYFGNIIVDDVRIYSRALTSQQVDFIHAQSKEKYISFDL